MPLEPFELQLESSQIIAPDVLHMNFVRSDSKGLESIPGQFITIHFDGPEGKRLRRSYSIATIPGQSERIEIAAAGVEGGAATQLLFNMQPGDTVETTGPFGRLVLTEDSPKTYWLIATGTGITPYRAMLPELVKRANEGVQINILAGGRTREHLLYSEDFLEASKASDNLHYHACLSRENPEDAQDHEHSGYVQKVLESLGPNAETDVVYLCGNPNMIDDTFTYLKEAGFTPQTVKREKYISAK